MFNSIHFRMHSTAQHTTKPSVHMFFEMNLTSNQFNWLVAFRMMKNRHQVKQIRLQRFFFLRNFPLKINLTSRQFLMEVLLVFF